MTEEFRFRITGTSVLMSFGELDAAMRHQYEVEIDNIEKRLVEIFDRRLEKDHVATSIGKMPTSDAIVKFR